MRRLDYKEIEYISYSLSETAFLLKFEPKWISEADLHSLFVSLALELDYVVKRVPRSDPKCPYTVEMAI